MQSIAEMYSPLLPMVEQYVALSSAELPEQARVRVQQMPFNLWDHISPCQRLDYARSYDYQNDPAYEQERAAGWLEAVYDAAVWWCADAITAPNATMLLSGYNPISETIESASISTNPEISPEDFRRLMFTIEGAHATPRTLKDWLGYARDKGVKTHSWLSQWEAWVAEVDNRNRLTTRSETLIESEKKIVPAVAYQPKLRSQGDWILQCVQSLSCDPKALPHTKNGMPGIKAEIWGTAISNPKLFPSRRAFDNAWQSLRSEGRLDDAV